jgi:predicted ATP-dependent endonuclease of OLD family
MFISKFSVKNYKSFLDSGDIEFKPGINIIVGQNNSGKTALLEALELRVEQNVYESEKTKPTANSQGNTEKSHTVSTIVFKAEEVKQILSQSNFLSFYIEQTSEPTKDLESFQQSIGKDLVMDLEDRQFSLFTFGNYQQENIIRRGRQVIALSLNQEGVYQSILGLNNAQSLADKFSNYLSENIYRFYAERINIGSSPIGISKELKPDASNLAEVLNATHNSNPVLYQKFVDLVTEVIPSVRGVTSITTETGRIEALNYEIRIWTISPINERVDLTIPLYNCGTGIGQVLAILYVAVTSKQPKIIIIDELNSFLHPGAAKKLIHILNKKKFCHHQYFISTHSPEILSIAKPSTVTQLRYIDGETKVASLDLSHKSELKNAFKEIGINQSDFFFSDSILWVEGETEEKAFPLILEKIGIENYTVLSVMPSEIRNRKAARKNTKNIFKIYKQLSGTEALIPSNILILLDREDYSDNDLRDDKKEFGESLHFIPRRMFENYLLNAEAITAVYNETAIEDAPQVTLEQVAKWIKENRNNPKYASKVIKKEKISSANDWVKNIDGAKLLYDLFGQLSDSANPFFKTTHSVMLTNWLLENKPNELSELKEFLIELIST